MNLKRKKRLAARTFGVGAGRIIFRNERIEEIKEAITKQDMKDLLSSNAIMIREITGQRKAEKRNRKRSFGKIKKKLRMRKKTYMHLTRKMREFAKQLLLQGRITKEEYWEIRKKIKSRIFRSKSHMSEIIKENLKPKTSLKGKKVKKKIEKEKEI